MANARAVEEVSISGKTRKKTNVFWSTVPEDEQFRNVQVPGVALDRFKYTKDIQEQKYARVVQKSKSDSAISNTRTSHLTVNKQGKIGQKSAAKKNDLLGGASSDQIANMSTLSESTRRASLKNLNLEDKKRVANLIKELAKTGEERELALERLQEERVCFDEQLSAVHEEQTALKQEREALKQRLEKSEKLLKKYENDLKNVKNEKEEQDKILKKKFHAQPQSTQTSPLIQNLGLNDTDKSWRFKDGGNQDDVKSHGTKKTLNAEAHIVHGESNDGDGRRKWSTPQVPVYSNSLFDVKVSNVEHEPNSEARSISEEYQGARVTETGSLHELYLREYSLQLRLQEQQIEIQQQQVQLRQQLQLLQQQQQQGLQQPPRRVQHEEQTNNFQPQQGLTQSREEHNQQHSYQQDSEQQHAHHEQQLEYKETHSNESHKHRSGEHHTKSLDQQPRDQSQNWQQPNPQEKNENIFKQASPTQQTNLLQKRTPELIKHQFDVKHQEDTMMVHKDAGHSPRKQHDRRRKHVMVRHEHEAEHYEQHCEKATKDRSNKSSSLPSHLHYHQFGRTAEDDITNKSDGQRGLDSTVYETHRMTERESPRKHHRTNDVKQIDLNNNEYFQPRSRSQKQRDNRYDRNGNLMKDHSPQEYFSESYSDSDDQPDEKCHNSESPCRQYHNHSRQHHATRKYRQHRSNHRQSKLMLQYSPKQKSPHTVVEIPHQKSEPIPTRVYQHPNMHHHSPNRTNTYHQRLTYDTQCTREHENIPPSNHHHLHKGEYHHHPNIHEEGNGVKDYGTTKNMRESAYGAAIYPPSKQIGNNHQPTERTVYTQVRPMSPPQPRMTAHGHLSSDRLQSSRPQMSKDRSQDLLDDYIHNHQTSRGYNAKSNLKSNEHSTKRMISRKGSNKMQAEGDTFQDRRRAMSYTTSNKQFQYEDENLDPGYSLYKPNTPQPTGEHREHPRTSPGPNHSQYSRTRYPNSLVDIVEELEVHSGYEERYSDDDEVYSTEERDYTSDEEESSVLDNIFFLKR